MKRAGVEKPALDLIEEAVQVLRQGGAALALPYLAGTIPFVLGLLYFVADMSRSPFAQSHCVPLSLVLSLLFLWMKACHICFSQAILASLHGQKPPGLALMAKALPAQAFFHSLGFIVLPIAALFTIPIGWTYAFFQNLLCMDLSKGQGVKSAWSQTMEQTLLRPAQNHFILLILGFFFLAVLVNVAGFLYLLPRMLKVLLGVDSRFLLSPNASVLNTTFLSATLALTYLCADPFIKAAYALRCYYGGAEASGEDIKARLRLLFPPRAALVLLAACLLCASPAARAASDGHGNAQPVVSRLQLKESIREVMERPTFSWRLPRDAAPEDKENEEPGFLAKALDWLEEQLAAMAETIENWARAVWTWLEKLFPNLKINLDAEEEEISLGRAKGLKIALYAALGLALAALLALFVKIRKRRLRPQESQIRDADPVKELNLLDEEVTADRLAANAWLNLARELAAKGSLLEALRAYYLSVLAHLAQENILSIARHKSNLEYCAELGRKARDKTELLDLFSEAVKVFEKHWYGLYPVDLSIVDKFALWQQRISKIAQRP